MDMREADLLAKIERDRIIRELLAALDAIACMCQHDLSTFQAQRNIAITATQALMRARSALKDLGYPPM